MDEPSQPSAIAAADQAAMRQIQENRAARAAASREARNRDFSDDMNMISGNGVKLNFPVLTAQNEVEAAQAAKRAAAAAVVDPGASEIFDFVVSGGVLESWRIPGATQVA